MKFGVTNKFDCSYLPEMEERLLVFVGYQDNDLMQQYETMLENGFRRSGEQIYRPHCPSCKACESLRIPVRIFKASKSQKRVMKKNSHLSIQIERHAKEEYYQLYEQYINDRHSDGAMYPASREQYDGFLFSYWASPVFMEFWDQDKLIAVAVIDELKQSLSALYTFFHPDYAQHSLGTFAVLQQIQLALTWNKPYLYLGYQIDACQKMNYKQKFLPNERFTEGGWQLFAK